MTDEQIDLQRRAYGEPFMFHPRHWTIEDWLREQPGDDMADKVLRIVKEAYRADYQQRGRSAMNRFNVIDLSQPGTPESTSIALATLSEAIEAFRRSGDNDLADYATELLRGVIVQIERGARAKPSEVPS